MHLDEHLVGAGGVGDHQVGGEHGSPRRRGRRTRPASAGVGRAGYEVVAAHVRGPTMPSIAIRKPSHGGARSATARRGPPAGCRRRTCRRHRRRSRTRAAGCAPASASRWPPSGAGWRTAAARRGRRAGPAPRCAVRRTLMSGDIVQSTVRGGGWNGWAALRAAARWRPLSAAFIRRYTSGEGVAAPARSISHTPRPCRVARSRLRGPWILRSKTVASGSPLESSVHAQANGGGRRADAPEHPDVGADVEVVRRRRVDDQRVDRRVERRGDAGDREAGPEAGRTPGAGGVRRTTRRGRCRCSRRRRRRRGRSSPR